MNGRAEDSVSGGIVHRVTVLILVLAAGSGFAAASAAGKTVKVGNYDFRPKAVTVEKGERVTWKGVRGSHNVTFERSPFNRRNFKRGISEGRRFSKRTRREGKFRYVCSFHDHLGMRGRVIVE
jgi:plastocyanin